ncbi:MAG: amidase family protein [Comamonadaceae bacterium]|nr:amidase family protein [Comamonadaceae bacterium]
MPQEFFPAGAGRRRRRRGARRAGRVREARRDAGRRQPAAHRAVDPRLLHHRAGRGRARTWRASTACSYGHRAAQYADLLDMYKKTRAEGFGAEVKRRIMIGTYVLSPRLLRRLLPAGAEAAPHDRRRLPARASAQCDVIAGPVAPTRGLEARRAGRRPGARPTWPTSSRCPASLAGLPGMSVPAGFGDGRHAGRPAADRQLLRRRRRCCTPRTRCQQATDWHTRAPAGV